MRISIRRIELFTKILAEKHWSNMSNELVTDDDLLVKAYNEAQLEPLTQCVDAVINCSDEMEDESSSKSEVDEAAAKDATFVVGDYVRCTYDDGIDYEAKILSINANRGTCRIKYAGYDNEQTVNMDALIVSWGEEARLSQCATARAEKVSAEVGKKAKTTSKTFNPPPVPPIPPMLFDSDDEEKNQQFAQLLISWFMTGYYTGLHQRSMQESKKLKK